MTQFFLWLKVFFINCKGDECLNMWHISWQVAEITSFTYFYFGIYACPKSYTSTKISAISWKFLVGMSGLHRHAHAFGGTNPIDGMFNFNTTFLVNNLGNYSSFILARPKVDCWPSSRWKQSIIKCAYERCRGSTILIWLHITTSRNI